MTSITSSIISLEGKSINITKSLPVSVNKILLAKILTSDIITIPIILVCDIIFTIVFKINLIDIVFILIASLIFPNFTALIGILVNLKYPKMQFDSDAEVIKQSTSSFISVLIGMLSAMVTIGLIIIGAVLGLNINIIVMLELLIFLAICIILWQVLKNYGVKKFNDINV